LARDRRKRPGGTGRADPADGPNILTFSLDDANDYVGFLGGYAANAHTPNLDALAASGRTFERAYCSVPLCFASRASVMWSQQPTTIDMVDDSAEAHGNFFALTLDPTAPNLAATMAAHGYHTVSRGKTYHDFRAGRWHTQDTYPTQAELNGQIPNGPDLFAYGALPPGATHPDQVTADWFSARLGDTYDRPFFMAVGLYQPHVPWHLPQWALDLHPLGGIQLPQGIEDDLDDVPPIGDELAAQPRLLGWTNWDLVDQAGTHAQIVQAYLAALSHTDAMVGQVMNDLASSPFANDTYVMTWSDHGYHLGEKLHFRKSALWEQSTRIPLTLAGPGISSDVFTHPVSILDFAPTVHDLAGAPMPTEWEGQSLVGITPAQADARPAHTWWEGAQAVRYQTWRYIEYPDATSELYDVATDPDELTNLTDNPAHAATKATLQGLLA
jgi:arylsulfatase A-like enzyme